MEPTDTPLNKAAEAQVMQDESAQIATPTADESSQAIEATAEESVIDVNSETPANPIMDSTEIEGNVTTGTEQPVAPQKATCPLGDCSPLQIGAISIVILIVVFVMIKLFSKKSVQQPAEKKNGKKNGADVVEIYVGNLSYDMTDHQLRREFERFGVVKSARVITHRTNNKSKGYGFVEMPHRKEALIAIKALENSEVLGRRIRVNEARANTRPPER